MGCMFPEAPLSSVIVNMSCIKSITGAPSGRESSWPTTGIYFPDHTIPTRQGIGFDEGMETYNLEYSYQSDKFSGSVTADFGRIDNPVSTSIRAAQRRLPLP